MKWLVGIYCFFLAKHYDALINRVSKGFFHPQHVAYPSTDPDFQPKHWQRFGFTFLQLGLLSFATVQNTI